MSKMKPYAKSFLNITLEDTKDFQMVKQVRLIGHPMRESTWEKARKVLRETHKNGNRIIAANLSLIVEEAGEQVVAVIQPKVIREMVA